MAKTIQQNILLPGLSEKAIEKERKRRNERVKKTIKKRKKKK